MRPRVLFLAAGTAGDLVPVVRLARQMWHLGMHVELQLEDGVRIPLTEKSLPDVFTAARWSAGLASSRWFGVKRCRAAGHAWGLRELVRDNLEVQLGILGSLSAKDHDVVVFTPMFFLAPLVAARLQLPTIALHFAPSLPTGDVSSAYLTCRDFPFGAANRATHAAVSVGARSILMGRRNVASELSVHTYADLLAESWERTTMHVELTSPTLLQSISRSRYHERRIGFVQPVLSAASLAGRPSIPPWLDDLTQRRDVVFFTQGSLDLLGHTLRLDSLHRALAAAGLALVTSAPHRIDAAGTMSVASGHVDYDALFPRLAAVITAGGAGTVAAAMRAQVPVIMVPQWFDQFFWARHLERLGVGRKVSSSKMETASGAAAVVDWLSHDIRPRMERVSRAMSTEPKTGDVFELLVRELVGQR